MFEDSCLLVRFQTHSNSTGLAKYQNMAQFLTDIQPNLVFEVVLLWVFQLSKKRYFDKFNSIA
jgi:hypothetical protein